MIIHKRYTKQPNTFIYGLPLGSEEKDFYYCNFAVGSTENKLTDDWREVTCKNCLKIKKKIIVELEEQLKELGE